MSTARVFAVFVLAVITTLSQSLLDNECNSMSQTSSSLYDIRIDDINCYNSTIPISFNISQSVATGESVSVYIRLIDRSRLVLKRKVVKSRTFNGEIYADRLEKVRNVTFKISARRTIALCEYHLNIGQCIPTTVRFLSSTVTPEQNQNTASFFNFASSSSTTLIISQSEFEFQPWYFLFVVPLLLLLVVVCVIVKFKREARSFTKFHIDQCKNDCNTQDQSNAVLSKFERDFSQKSQEVLQKSKQNVRLFLVFSDDHKKHREVIVNFVKFLQADLGFEVFCELFQTHQISIDPFHWMEKCLKEADKVVVIWSPGAARQWNTSDTELLAGYMLAPILKRIRNDLFLGLNIGKYYFGYFDYCNETSIPEVFSQPQFLYFKLMQEFEELFFRLRGIEMYLPGGVVNESKVKFHSYSNSSLNKHGEALQKSIFSMAAYVREHPNWHEEKPDNSLYPNQLLFSEQNYVSEITNNHLAIIPPSPLLNEHLRISSPVDENSNEVDNSFTVAENHIGSKRNAHEAELNNFSKDNFINRVMTNSNLARSTSDCIAPKQKPLFEFAKRLSEAPKNKKKIKFADELSVKSLPGSVRFNGDDHTSRKSSNCVNLRFTQSSFKSAPVEHLLPKDSCKTAASADYCLSAANSESLSTKSKPISISQNTSFNAPKNTLVMHKNKTVLPTSTSGKKMTNMNVRLAPLDTSSDPMVSLMSLNMLSTHQLA